MYSELAIVVIAILAIPLIKRGIFSGPVEFYDKDIGTTFFLLKISDDNEVITLLPEYETNREKEQEFILPKHIDPTQLNVGGKYVLEVSQSGNFTLLPSLQPA